MKGIIVLWSGAIVDIPSGWHLCDGTQGTPNLRNRFVVGAGDTYAPDDSDVGIPTSYVDRGDPTNWDFSLNDFIKDNAYHELDLSGIVPAGAPAVTASLLIQATAAAKIATFRKAGNQFSYNVSKSMTQIAGFMIASDIIIALSVDRKIEYRFSTATWLDSRFAVKGWWVGTLDIPDDTVGYYALAYIMKL